jgi:hypothetical protein
MENFLFDQLRRVREVTVDVAKDVTDSQAVAIPSGFNNNILWNLGHIYLIQERFAFHFAQEPVEIPDGFNELFSRGTKPSDWAVQLPSLPSLIEMLKEQPDRIEKILKGRLNESVAQPFTTSSGVTLKTCGEFLVYSLYHEGMHVQSIRMIKRFSK